MITEEILKLLARQTLMMSGLSLQVIQMLIRLWRPFRAWTDEDLVLARAARSATTIETAVRQARQRERSYNRFLFREMGIESPSEAEIDAAIIGFRKEIAGVVNIYPRNADALEVWMRPAEQYRYHVSTGLAENESLVKALQRVEQMAHTDVLLARREETRGIYKATPKIIGWRRVIHPELAEDKQSCGLCVVASQRTYSSDELMPIHDECNCTTMPITKDQDPGKLINDDDLKRIYEAAGSNNAGDLLKTKVSFTEHGELGPIMKNTSVKGYEGSKKARRLIAPDDRSVQERLEHEVEILTASMQRLVKRSRNGERGLDQSISWQRDRIAELNRQITALRRA